jgi:aspartate ammonia-lyase
MRYRTEKDIIGERQVPEDAYWGIHTLRASENFPLSGYRVNPALIKAIVFVKKAAVLANKELGYLDAPKADAIICSCDRISEGIEKRSFLPEFPVDALQGGAGTSTNMNVNEVIANCALEITGKAKGDYTSIDPIEDVNKHQSTNDVYPTALKIACIYGLRRLSATIEKTQGAFQAKEKEFAGIVKMGRTELQDAVPITLGAEFSVCRSFRQGQVADVQVRRAPSSGQHRRHRGRHRSYRPKGLYFPRDRKIARDDRPRAFQVGKLNGCHG